MPDGQRLSSKITSDTREVRSADVQDGERIAYGKGVCDSLTSWHKNRDFNGHAFIHTRELALDKASSLLCVLDTIESKSEFTGAFGPVWHVQHVLTKNEQGFLCRSDFQDKIDGRPDASKPRPVWIGMKGPSDTSLNDVEWKFRTRNGHSELPQENHLTAEWRGSVKPGDKLSFFTVLVPQPEGTTTPLSGLILDVQPGKASVHLGDFSYSFPTLKNP